MILFYGDTQKCYFNVSKQINRTARNFMKTLKNVKKCTKTII